MKKQSLAQKLLALLLVFVLSGVLALPVFADEANGTENGYEYENGYEGEESDEGADEEDYDADKDEDYDAEDEDEDYDEEDADYNEDEDYNEEEEEEYVEIEPISEPVVYVLTVEVDGVEVDFIDQGPVMVDNRVLVPVRGAFDAMGFDEPDWNRSTREATLTRGDVVIVIPADGTTFTVNGATVTPDVPQRMMNRRLMLPLSAIAEAVRASHEWDSATQTAHIFTAVEDEPVAEEPAEDYDEEDEDYDEEADDEEDYEYDYNEEDKDADDEDDDDEFVLYTSSTYGFSIYHPASWVVADAQEIAALVEQLAHLLNDDALALFENAADTDAAVTWFDPTNATPTFMANTSIIVGESGGLTVEMLQEDEAKEILAEMFDELLAETFTSYVRIGDVVGVTAGDNYFIVFEANVSMLGADSSFFQAITVVGNNLYTFTFSTPHGALDVELFISMLETFTA